MNRQAEQSGGKKIRYLGSKLPEQHGSRNLPILMILFLLLLFYFFPSLYFLLVRDLNRSLLRDSSRALEHVSCSQCCFPVCCEQVHSKSWDKAIHKASGPSYKENCFLIPLPLDEILSIVPSFIIV